VQGWGKHSWDAFDRLTPANLAETGIPDYGPDEEFLIELDPNGVHYEVVEG
jgi:hypothetical protein